MGGEADERARTWGRRDERLAFRRVKMRKVGVRYCAGLVVSERDPEGWGWDAEKRKVGGASYRGRRVVEDVERDDAEEVDGDDKGQGDEHLALGGGEGLRGDEGEAVVFLDDFKVGCSGWRMVVGSRVLAIFGRREGGMLEGDVFRRRWRAPALDPQRDGHDGEAGGDKHGAGEIGAN